MHIHLGGDQGHLQSIELTHANHHKVLPHLNKLISCNKPEHFKTINKIHIENSSLDNSDYSALENIMHHCSELFVVELNSNHIDTLHAHNLLCSLTETHLKSLSFTDNWIGEKIPKDFFDSMKNQPEITSLDLSLNWLRDKGIITLVESLRPCLDRLNLSCNDFHFEGMRAISNFVVNNPHLLELDVSYNHIDAKSAESIAQIIKECNSIQSIKANSNQIGDEGAVIIADALHHNLKPIHLDLSDNGISDKGVKRLLDAASINNVTIKLDLKHNPINKIKLTQMIQAKQKDYSLMAVVF
jgi:Ran GTPase-activating protein (RanGAP) involved in mRNA processing and transport